MIPRPIAANVVGNKCEYHIKLLADDNTEGDVQSQINCKDLNQQRGIDFTETFSLAIKPTTIRTFWALAISNQWCPRQ